MADKKEETKEKPDKSAAKIKEEKAQKNKRAQGDKYYKKRVVVQFTEDVVGKGIDGKPDKNRIKVAKGEKHLVGHTHAEELKAKGVVKVINKNPTKDWQKES